MSAYVRLTVLVGFVLLLSSVGSAQVAADTQPVLEPIHAVFKQDEFATHYTVQVTNTTAKPSYSWALQPPSDNTTCNKFEVTPAGNEAIWHHSNADGCTHNGPQHNGTIIVVVLVGGWKCTATYFGTLDGDGPQPDPCTATVEPPLAQACKCSDVTMKTSPENFTDDHTFEFAAHWTIKCQGTGGTCRGEIEAEDPVEVRGALHYDTDMTSKTNKGKPPACAGRCGRKSTGTFHYVGKSAHDLRRTARRGKTFLVKFTLYCADKGTKKTKVGRAEMKIVFDKRGFLDRKKSDFNG